MPPCTLGITIRNTSDICIRNRLHFGSALRMIDHHLHASGILLPHASSRSLTEQNPHGQVYNHNWFCVAQSVTTPTAEKLKYLALQDKTDTAQIHTWISTIGKSSVQLASSINATHDNNMCLALAKRVFVRRAPDDITSAAPFTDDESKQFARFMYDNNMQILPDLSDIDIQETQYANAPPSTSSTTTKDNHKMPAAGPVLRLPIGPQHCNFSNHVDHAVLAETAALALWKAGVSEEERNDTLKIQYVAEVTLHDGNSLLECHVKGDDNLVCLYQNNNQNDDGSSSSKEDLTLVAVAELASSQDKKLHSRHY